MSLISARRCLLIGIASLVVFAASGAAEPRPDAHDSLVYRRYSRKVKPGTVKYAKYAFTMKHTELKRPATKADVAGGKAVFSLEGLGKVRVWKLPECPVFSIWTTLRDFPHKLNTGETGYDNHGYVCQAEELLVNGKWKRYFGFVCEHGVAVAPAEEVDLWLGTEDPCRMSWQHLPKGVDWGVVDPPRRKKNGKTGPKHLDVGDPLPVEVHVRNRRGVAKRMPFPLYRDAGKGGPAFRKGIKLCLARAPFDPRTPDAHYPRDDHYKPVKPARNDRFVVKEPGRLLKTGESFKAFTFDLRDWFRIDKPGYYLFHFEFDEHDMNMPPKEYQGAGQVSFGFILGTPPKRMTFAELNKGVAPFGGKENEKRLRRLITETIKPPKPAATLPFPDNFPKLSRVRFMAGSMSPWESDFKLLRASNWKLLSTLTKYDPARVRREFDKRMIAEKDLPMKLLLGSVAASAGSEKAALFLLESMKDTDYHAVRNVHSALGYVFYSCGKKQPDWIVELIIAALSDRRYATGLKKTSWSSGTHFRISYLADEDGCLTYALGRAKYRKAVPFLIEMAKRTKGRRGPIAALGQTGDRRAIPVLMHFLKIGAAEVNRKGEFLSDKFLRSADALADLKAKEAVGLLLERMEYPSVIEALKQIADPRVIGPFRELVAAKGKIIKNGKSVLPDLEQYRAAAAMIALACLKEGDSVPRLCALLSEKSLGEFQRRDVVRRLGDRRDPRAIPYLIKAIKTDPSGAVVNQAITVLSVFKYKAAVEGLIECFDVDFKGKSGNWKKGTHTSNMYREDIAASLRKITGHDLGPDKKAWLKWWRHEGNALKGLK